MEDKNDLLKLLPKVDSILSDKRFDHFKSVPRVLILDAIRETLKAVRKDVLSGKLKEINNNEIISKIEQEIELRKVPNLRRVINATGTVLHTNLGRAVLSRSAAKAVIDVSSSYSNLEFDIERGDRGERYSHIEELVCRITGAEAALVVNNNAAAVMLVLSTLARDKEAIVSRGELVEIGGSFRVPAVMELSGAKLVEVGTTNRTHLYDYENAITDNTGVILKVHQSNFRIIGFTGEAELEELVRLGNMSRIPVVEDIGSGIFIDISKYGLKYEPTVQNSIKKGVDIVTFSGDKLLGGPQAGIIAGKAEYISMMKKNQLTRALRIDKMTLAALEETLRLYLDEEKAIKEIPVINMMLKDIMSLKKDAQRLMRMIKNRLGDKIDLSLIKDYSQVGGGAMPYEMLETYAVTISTKAMTVDLLEKKLRTNIIPIITRINRNRIIIDVRTLFECDFAIITDRMEEIFQNDSIL